jgi:hypothetical protein
MPSKQINVSLSDLDFARYQKFAKATGIGLPDFARQAFKYYADHFLEAHQQKLEAIKCSMESKESAANKEEHGRA